VYPHKLLAPGVFVDLLERPLVKTGTRVYVKHRAREQHAFDIFDSDIFYIIGDFLGALF
jgi:hypothetical protein